MQKTRLKFTSHCFSMISQTFNIFQTRDLFVTIVKIYFVNVWTQHALNELMNSKQISKFHRKYNDCFEFRALMIYWDLQAFERCSMHNINSTMTMLTRNSFLTLCTLMNRVKSKMLIRKTWKKRTRKVMQTILERVRLINFNFFCSQLASLLILNHITSWKCVYKRCLKSIIVRICNCWS